MSRQEERPGPCRHVPDTANKELVRHEAYSDDVASEEIFTD